MSKVLYIQASPTVERSFSIAVADSFVEAYKKNNPGCKIVKLNIFDESLPPFDDLAVQAKYSILEGRQHSQAQIEAWKEVERVIEQFTSADKYVLAIPMWNFSIPYRLKQYIDLLIQPGYTFTFSEDKGYEGLVVGKPMLAIYARGGQYSAGGEAGAFDLQTRYIEQIFRFIGFEDVRSVIIEPTLQAGPDVAAARRDAAIEQVRKLAVDF
jgi:FMN-dependent NADH-azoreductase